MDKYLKALVDNLEKSERTDLKIGITLMVEGLMVTGELISSTEYFTKFVALFSASSFWSDEDKKTIQDHYSAEGLEASSKGSFTKNYVNDYIHLRNASVIMSPSGAVPAKESIANTLWRGRLDSVSGFILGSLSVGA